jgi:hypothetical protein
MFHIPLQIALQALIETTTKVWDVFDRRKKEASDFLIPCGEAREVGRGEAPMNSGV